MTYAISDTSDHNSYDQYDELEDGIDHEFLTDEERQALAGDNDDSDSNADANTDENINADENTGTDTDGSLEDPVDNSRPSHESAFTPKLEVQAVDADAINSLRAEREALQDKLEVGDISAREYHAAFSKLTDQITDLSQAAKMAEFADRQNQQIAEQRWAWEQDAFMRDNPQYKDDAILRGALDAQLRIQYADEGADKVSGLDHLRNAAKAIAERFSPKTPAAKESPDKPASRKADLSLVPNTLASAPASGVNTNTFEDIDNLVGLKKEQALARLSKDQREAYLSGG